MTSGIIHADTRPAHWYQYYYLYCIIPEEAAMMGFEVPTWQAWRP